MTLEEIAFLVLIFGGLSIFGIVLGVVAWWSSKPASHIECRPHAAERISVSPADGHLA